VPSISSCEIEKRDNRALIRSAVEWLIIQTSPGFVERLPDSSAKRMEGKVLFIESIMISSDSLSTSVTRLFYP
jgi:hypothetical protein